MQGRRKVNVPISLKYLIHTYIFISFWPFTTGAQLFFLTLVLQKRNAKIAIIKLVVCASRRAVRRSENLGAKGQIKLKADWCARCSIDSPKKWTNSVWCNYATTRYGKKNRSVCSFFRRTYGAPICLQIYLNFCSK